MPHRQLHRNLPGLEFGHIIRQPLKLENGRGLAKRSVFDIKDSGNLPGRFAKAWLWTGRLRVAARIALSF